MFVDGTTDFEMTRGDSETIGVKLKNYELKAGDTVYLTVRKRPKSEDVVFQKVVTEFDNGRGAINIEPEDTSDQPWGVYYYDIEIRFSNGVVKTFVKPSIFHLLWEVTRP